MKKRIYFLLAFVLCAVVFCMSVCATEPKMFDPVVKLSSDSVQCEFSYDIYFDNVSQKTILDIEIDTFGVCVYDDKNTSIIEGVRINDETVDSLKIPIDLTRENTVIIRTVYNSDFTGTLAQITDGTYDYTNLLKNPVGLVTVIYYAIAIVTLIVGLISSAVGKKLKVKTADEIASTIDTRTVQALDNITNGIVSEIAKNVAPLFKSITETQTVLIEAITLMNSKDPNSHLAALECLKKVASKDIATTIETVVADLNQTIQNAKNHKQENIDTLTVIAETTQEVSANVTPKDLPIL